MAQYNLEKGQYAHANDSLVEVVMLANADGVVNETNPLQVVNNWEEAVSNGQAYEMSAVADGAYALAAYHDMIMTANSGENAQMNFSGFFINSSNFPILVEFWEGGTWTGGDTGATMTAINRDRNSSNVSSTTMTLKAYYATPIVHATTGTLLTQLTIYSGANGFNFTNLEGVSELWHLKPNTDYTVRIRNSAATASSISARMLWFETAI